MIEDSIQKGLDRIPNLNTSPEDTFTLNMILLSVNFLFDHHLIDFDDSLCDRIITVFTTNKKHLKAKPVK
jgi:hypothetical protein